MTVGQSSPLATHGAPRANRNGLGLAYMALGMFLFAAVDTQAKFLTDSLHPVQIAWSRQMGLVVGIAALVALRGFSIMKTDRLPLQLVRGSLVAGSTTLFIVAISYVQLADAVAVSFVAPFFVTLLGAIILGERVGLRRWTAVVIGFLGALVVIRPGMGVIHPAVLLVAVAAVLFAFRQVFSRMLSRTDGAITTLAYTAIASGILLTVPLPLVWQTPEHLSQVILLISIGALAALAEFFMIKALEVAEAVIVAPVQYTLLLWGVMYGFLVFGQLPDLWTWVGATIIIATGIYTLNRERLAARRAKQPIGPSA